MAKKAHSPDNRLFGRLFFFMALPLISSQNEMENYITAVYPCGGSQLEMRLARYISQKIGVFLNRRLQLKANPPTSLYATVCHVGIWGAQPTALRVLHHNQSLAGF